MIESRNVEFKVDQKRFLRVFLAILPKGGKRDAVDTVFLSFCLAECCWNLFEKGAGRRVGNLDEFRSEMKVAAVKFAEMLGKQ